MTPICNQPPYLFATLCVEKENNERLHPRVTTPILCGAEFDIPRKPQYAVALPYYVVVTDDGPRTGRWVHVIVEMEMLVAIFVAELEDITTFAATLCTVCNFPVSGCYCGNRLSPANRTWLLECERYGEIKTHTDLVRALGSKKSRLYLSVEFQNVSVQNKKTYVEIMTNPEQLEPFVKVVEDFAALFYQLRECTSIQAVLVAVGVCVRSVTGRSNAYFVKDLKQKFIAELGEFFMPQSDGHWTTTLSDIYENYSRAKDSKLARRLKAVFNHLIMHCVYHKLGIEVDRALFEKMEKTQVRPTLAECATFADAVVGLVTFLLKHGRQCMLAGSIEPMFMDGDSITEWLTKAKGLKSKFEFLGNPAAVGIDLYTYLQDLDRCIDGGRSMIKFMSHHSPEQRVVLGIASELETLRNRYLSVNAACALRKQPLGVVIYGTPGIGKSSVLDILFDYDAKIRGRSTDRSHRFQFSSNEDYMTNFRSSMHTIVLDDVAQHQPGKVQGIDKTIEYIISIINNQGYCPPQAALEDKGKTPILSDLVLVTTNKKDMNIPLYYNSSYAVYRRIPIHIEPVVKPEYRKDNSMDIDPAKCESGPYPDHWSFRVSVAKSDGIGSMTGSYEFLEEFPGLAPFLAWFKTKSDEHHRNQSNFMAQSEKYQGVALCPCGLPRPLCDTCTISTQALRVDGFGSLYWVNDEHQECEDHIVRNVQIDTETATREGSYDPHTLVGTEDELWKRAWRKTGPQRGPPRTSSFQFGCRFIKNTPSKDVEHAKVYAYEELPFLLRLGASNEYIKEDFASYTQYYDEVDHLDETEGMLDIFMCEVRDQTGIVEDSLIERFVRWMITLWFTYASFRSAARFLGRSAFIRRQAIKYLRPHLLKTKTQKHFAHQLGAALDRTLGGNNVWVKAGLKMLQIVVTSGVVFALLRMVRSQGKTAEEWDEISVKEQEKKIVELGKHGVDEPPSDDFDFEGQFDNETEQRPKSIVEKFNSEVFDEEMDLADFQFTTQPQALREVGTFPKAAEGDERRNPWAMEERCVTSVDFLPQRVLQEDVFVKRLARNTLRFCVWSQDAQGPYQSEGRLLVLGNDSLVTNNHSIPMEGEIKMTVYLGGDARVNPHVSLSLQQSQIQRIHERDICVLRTSSLPALFKDISNNFVRSTFQGGYDGFYLLKQADGSVEKRAVYNVRRTHFTRGIGEHFFDFECYTGIVTTPTQSGDCGSPLVLVTGYGPVVVGFHSLFVAESNRVYATMFTHEDSVSLGCRMLVQAGRTPIDEERLYVRQVSYVDFHDAGTLMYHGELKGFRQRQTHSVVHSELFEQLIGREIGGKVIEDKLTSPVMDGWRAQQLALEQIIDPVKYMNEPRLEKIRKVLVGHLLKELPGAELDLLGVVPLDVAVNGVPGMAYMDRIKMSTSMGNPYGGPKRQYLEDLDDPRWPNGVKFKDEIEKAIEEMHDLMCQGIRPHAVFVACLKNEAVSWKKKRLGKTRTFYCCPGTLLVIVRMYLMSFCRVVQRNRGIFMCAVGLDASSTEWDELFKYLTRFGFERAIAGDYEFYDKKFKVLFMHIVTNIIIDICVASGNYTEQQLLVLTTMMSDLASPTVDFFGMLVTFLGSEVSGHQFTTIFNCFANIVYLMYAYEDAGYDCADFFEHVVAVVLGDDHVLCVSPERPLYTHTAIRDCMASIGVGYTMADKTSESVAYISIWEATFLKRAFRFDPELGVVVGNLDLDSIFKMLTMQVLSKNCSPSEQLAQAMTSAVSESFFHGREVFEAMRELLISCKKSEALAMKSSLYPLPTYEQCLARFWLKDDRAVAYGTGPKNQKNPRLSSNCAPPDTVPQCGVRMDRAVFPARAFPEVCIYRSVELDTSRNLRRSEHESALFAEKNRLSKTNQELNSAKVSVPETEGSEITIQEQTAFVNETAPVALDLSTPLDSIASSHRVPAELGDFLSRPSKIGKVTWTENGSSGIKYSFNPWKEYFSAPSIKNKLQNYGLIRCKLKVRFTINASQFYYGSLGAFYTPLKQWLKDTTGPNTAYPQGRQVVWSQKPHVWLDPQSTSTAEMTLPFLYHRNWLWTDTGVMNAMGTIDLIQFAALRSANGVTTTGVNIIVYAWAEDVEVTAPTALAVMQSKKTRADEYGSNRQVSNMASTVASAASQFKNVPVVGDFAKATEMAATSIGAVADYFGFTNVPVVEDVKPMKNMAFHTLASAEISEPIAKLSLQPKQEVSVSTTELGDALEDPLHIAHFCARESFLCGVLWGTSNTEDAVLFTASVTPELYEKSQVANFAVFDTPMSHVARMFEYWRGDIIFRFKVIKSQYHRGRVNICWDARSNSASLMPGYGEPGVMNILFDLETQDEIEVRVPWMQAQTFLRMDLGTRADPIPNPPWSNGPSPTFTWTGNGMIQVRVVNRLTAPEASSDVDLLVFVRGAENLEFAAPNDISNKLSLYELQSKKTYGVQTFGQPSVSDINTYNEVFGERIVSLREVLHRASKTMSILPNQSSGNFGGIQQLAHFPIKRLPRAYGFTANGIDLCSGIITPANTYSFNYVRNHPITWIANCFVGYKGSTNYTINVCQFNGKYSVAVPSVSVVRNGRYGPFDTKPYSQALPAASGSTWAWRLNCVDIAEDSGGAGMALTNQYTQAGLAFNLPYYSASRFMLNNVDTYYGATATADDSHEDWFTVTVKRGIVNSTVDQDLTVDFLCGTGPDFNLIFFLNVPVKYFTPAPTPA